MKEEESIPRVCAAIFNEFDIVSVFDAFIVINCLDGILKVSVGHPRG